MKFDLFTITYTFIFEVSFNEKEIAKSNGLRWSPTLKKWYKDIKSNGDISEISLELGDTCFKIIDIISDLFNTIPEQKQILLKHCLSNFENKEKKIQDKEEEYNKKYEKRRQETELDELEEKFNKL